MAERPREEVDLSALFAELSVSFAELSGLTTRQIFAAFTALAAYDAVKSSVWSRLQGMLPDEKVGPGAVLDAALASDAYEDYADKTREFVTPDGTTHAYEVLTTVTSKTVFQPDFRVLRKRDEDGIVVAVRGTNSAKDVVTDVKAQSVPFADGYVHEGMYRSASWLAEKVAAAASDAGTRNVKLVGHSLGGGAAMVTALFLASTVPEVTVTEVVAFGAPPVAVMGPELQALSNAFPTTVFVHRDDIIPRLSAFHARKFAHDLATYQKSTSMVSWVVGAEPRIEPGEHEQLTHFGRVTVLHEKEGVYVASRVPSAGAITLTTSMLSDHSVEKYKGALTSVVTGMAAPWAVPAAEPSLLGAAAGMVSSWWSSSGSGPKE